MHAYQIIGLMSGTSLDGIDLAACQFSLSKTGYSYRILRAETLSYSAEWKKRLSTVETGSALELMQLDRDLGKLMGETVNAFIKKHQLKGDWIVASHGHTIFHRPESGFTTQIGHPAVIRAFSNCPVVGDFRSLDVALGGQGAPLVPIGDRLLFENFDYCLNLGGVANVSFEKQGKRMAGDVCFANLVLNHLATQLHVPFDRDGELARSGEILPDLLDRFNSLSYYQQSFPKSLGKENFLATIAPLLSNLDPKNALRTWVEHCAIQIGQNLTHGMALVTGGGAKNTFLMERINAYSNSEIQLPEKELIDFKEALIFAFLGYLRLQEKENVLQSVTGSKFDHAGGAYYC